MSGNAPNTNDFLLRDDKASLTVVAAGVDVTAADATGTNATAHPTIPGTGTVLTAAGNDYGFERIFSRQIESLVNAKDVVVALSTSGTSPNIIRGAEAARAQGAYLVAFTGETGGKLVPLADLLLNVPSTDPQRIQESHITIGHIACALIEKQTSGVS